MIDGLHRSGLITDDQYTAGLHIQSWAHKQREKSPTREPEIKSSGFGVGWPASLSLFWVRSWVGPFAWRVIEMALIEDATVAEIEAVLDLPARSAKVALKTALSSAAACIHDEKAVIGGPQ